MTNLAVKIALEMTVLSWLSGFLLYAQEIPADSVAVGLPAPVGEVIVQDRPNDIGGALIVQWGISPDDTATGAGIDGYKIYRAMEADGPYEVVDSLPAGSVSFEDSGLNDGQKYYYKVSSFRDQLESKAMSGGPAVPSGQ